MVIILSNSPLVRSTDILPYSKRHLTHTLFTPLRAIDQGPRRPTCVFADSPLPKYRFYCPLSRFLLITRASRLNGAHGDIVPDYPGGSSSNFYFPNRTICASGHGRDPEGNLRVLFKRPSSSLGWAAHRGLLGSDGKGRKGRRRFNVGYYVCMTTRRPELADGTWDSIKTRPHKEAAASRVSG